MSKSKLYTLRMEPETMAAAKLVAHVEARTVSSLILFALKHYIQSNYPDANTPGAKLVMRIERANAPKGPLFTGDMEV